MSKYKVVLIRTAGYDSIGIITREDVPEGLEDSPEHRPVVYVNGKKKIDWEALGMADLDVARSIKEERPDPEDVMERTDIDHSYERDVVFVDDDFLETMDDGDTDVPLVSGRTPILYKGRYRTILPGTAEHPDGYVGPWVGGKYVVLDGKYVCVGLKMTGHYLAAERIVEDWADHVSKESLLG